MLCYIIITFHISVASLQERHSAVYVLFYISYPNFLPFQMSRKELVKMKERKRNTCRQTYFIAYGPHGLYSRLQFPVVEIIGVMKLMTNKDMNFDLIYFNLYRQHGT